MVRGNLPNKEAMPLGKIQAYLLPGASDKFFIIYNSGCFSLSFMPPAQEGQKPSFAETIMPALVAQLSPLWVFADPLSSKNG